MESSEQNNLYQVSTEGIGMKLPEEIAHGDYPAIIRMLAAAGARLPGYVNGSEVVQETLREMGVQDAE